MCGIFGIVARRDAGYSAAAIQKALRILGACAEWRGRDSSGLVFCDEQAGAYRVFKGALPLHQLARSPAVRKQLQHSLAAYAGDAGGTFAVIGHSRLVTNGSQLRDENNQPVIKDGIIGIHNGIVVNDRALWKDNPDLSREFEIDTEVIFALVRKNLAQGRTVSSAIAHTEAVIHGTFSTALLFTDIGALALATNNGSLYTLTDGRDVLFFASEQYPLRAVAEELRLPADRFVTRHVGSWSGVVLGFEGFTVQPFSFAAARNGAAMGATAPRAAPPFSIEQVAIGNGQGQGELVLDVAAIANAPGAAKEAALLEFNADRVAALRRCKKCILPETFPFIEFDEAGVCNYCHHYRRKLNERPLADLEKLLEPYRRSDGMPDCIVPFSGGRDSTYALHTIKTTLRLNPIAFTYDWGMVTDLGRRNIARVCGKLGVENIIVAADIHRKRRNIRKNINAWLARPHLGMVPLFMAGDKYFYYYIEQVKRQTGIRLNIWGINPLENTDFKVGFIGVDPDPLKKRIYSLTWRRKAKLFAGAAGVILANPRYLNSSVWDTLGGFVSRSILPHRDYFHLYDFVRWDEETIDRLLFEEYDWEKAIDTSTTWRIGDGTASFYNYIYYTVAGFSEHDTFRSNQIREGVLGREEALRRVNEENKPRYATIRWYADVVQFDYERAVRIINAIPKLYR